MSILIKGMEMPTHCTECDFWHDGVFEHCLLNMEIQNEDIPLDEGEFPNDCPLVPIPPHGRLIDADTLTVRHGWLDNFDNTHTHIQFVYANEIYSTPTIIESEKEVKDG